MFRRNEDVVTIEGLTDAEAAWVAGFIDGDGTITLSKTSDRRWKRPDIRVDSADIELLEYLKSLVGGSIVRKKKYADHHRQCHTWALRSNSGAIALLRRIRPYLRGNHKRERANMIVDLMPHMTKVGGHYDQGTIEKKIKFEAEFFASGSGRGSRLFKTPAPQEPVRSRQ